jgi:hypothetical protein
LFLLFRVTGVFIRGGHNIILFSMSNITIGMCVFICLVSLEMMINYEQDRIVGVLNLIVWSWNIYCSKILLELRHHWCSCMLFSWFINMSILLHMLHAYKMHFLYWPCPVHFLISSNATFPRPATLGVSILRLQL